MSAISNIPLESVDGWTDDVVGRMQAVWVTTAQQVVALAATDNGFRSIVEQLQVDPEEARALVEAARARLPANEQIELSAPADTSDYGTGVLPPRQEDDESP
ncbi:hypothetical protein [Rhodococcus sp. NPDC003348]